MSEQVSNNMPEKVVLRKLAELKQAPFSPRGASTNELIGADIGATIASGIVYFRDAEIPFTLWYDEVLICHTVEGSFEVSVNGKSYPLTPGDMMWLPRGTSLIYRSQGMATAFFAVTPADWVDRKPPS